jgi:hypothetical protein
MATPQTKKIEKLRADFFSADEKVVLEALSQCRNEGNQSLIEPLILLYSRTDSDLIRHEAGDILGSIKISEAEEAFMNAVMNPALRSVRRDLLAFMWNSGLQPVGWLTEITRIALGGSTEELIECITLIESTDDAFPEEQILESIHLVREHLNRSNADDRTNLVAAYMGVLERLQEE